MWTGTVPVAKAAVTAVAFAPDGRALYTADTSGHVIAWDTHTHESRVLYQRPKPIGRVGIYRLWPTADGTHLFLRDGFALHDAFRPGGGSPLKTVEFFDLRYVTPDGTRAFGCTSECHVEMWDVATGEPLPVPGELGQARDITYHNVLPDGATLLTYSSRSNELRLWNLRTGAPVGALAPNGPDINPCALASDGTAFAVGRNRSIWVYDVPARALQHKMKFEKDIRNLAFHPGARLLASASTNSVVTFWDAVAGRQVGQFDWRIGKVESLCFSPDGLTCAAGGGGGRFAVFDVDL